MVHVRELDGKPLRFGHSGWLWNNAYLLYDEGTQSLWHHLWGTALSGPLRGRSLRRLPTSLLTYGAWRREHPGTLVLRKPDPAPNIPSTEVDVYARRNANLSFGYAIDAGGVSRLHRYAAFPESDVLEDEIAGVPYVLVRDARARGAFAWDRRVGGRALSFEGDARPDAAPDARPVLRERGGNRAWYARSGAPVPGSGADSSLVPLLGSVWEVSAWALQHPKGETWAPSLRVPGRR